MSEPRISLRQARIALHVAIVWQIALVLIESQRGWRIVEYAAWLMPAIGLFVITECVLLGIDSIDSMLDVTVRQDLRSLRFRLSIVTYLGSIVIFTREAFVAGVLYSLARVLAVRLHDGRALWMVTDAAMLVASLVYLALGELDLLEFSAALTVMVTIVTVAIYQDDTSP